jgi:hypothetical protein
MSDIILQSFCKLASLSFPPNDGALMKIHVAKSEAWLWNPPSLVAFECLLLKGWKKEKDLQSTYNLNSTRLKRRWMNCRDPFQELMKKRNRRISRTTMTSYPMPGPSIHNKCGSKPLMGNPLPFFVAQWPFFDVTSISHGLANKQIGRERNNIPITL